jgi:uncharacterized protein
MMKYRRFGKTEINMPIFSCGGMRFQQSWEQLQLAEIIDENQKNLKKTVAKAFKLGINHFETARGYGSSEIQLGPVLRILPREKIIIQTKVGVTKDSEEFLKNLETSFINLQLDYADLIAIHGINNEESFDNMFKCLDILEEWKQNGKIRHIGFSTHGPCNLIEKIIKTNRFDYVNLHYYYIFQNNLKALQAAENADMGVFIISPNDKGGKLYSPPVKLKGLTAPLTPMQFNDLFCLANPAIHTLSIGASKPEDFLEHLEVLEKIDKTGVTDNTAANITEKLNHELERVLGAEWVSICKENLPDYTETPDEINIPVIMRLYNLAKGLNMLEYGKMRYNLLGEGGSWFPGNKAENIEKSVDKIIELCQSKNIPFADKIPAALEEAHQMLNIVKNEK